MFKCYKKINIIVSIILSFILLLGNLKIYSFADNTYDADGDNNIIKDIDINSVSNDDFLFVDDNKNNLKYVPNEVIISCPSDVSDSKIENIIDEYDGEVNSLSNVKNHKTAVVEFSDDINISKTIDELSDEKIIQKVQPNYIYHIEQDCIPNDLYVNNQYYLDYNANNKGANVYNAWRFIANNNLQLNKVKVAVLDTGVDINHPDLKDIINKNESAEIVETTNQGIVPTNLYGDGTGLHEIVNLKARNSNKCKLNKLIGGSLLKGTDENFKALNPLNIDDYTMDNKNPSTITEYNKAVDKYNQCVTAYNSLYPTSPRKDSLDKFKATYHGTHVAGTIGANYNNHIGIAGVASYNNSVLDLVSVDCMSDSNSTTTAHIVAGLKYARNIGAKIVNMSLGCEGTDNLLTETCNELTNSGIVLVCAAGNSGKNEISTPGGIPNNIGVINTTSKGYKSSSSTYGKWYDISAPGTDIYATLPSSSEEIYATCPKCDYGNLSGTSMATPIVTGVVSLMLSVNPSLSVKNVNDIIISTATDLYDKGFDDYSGYGLIDAYSAVIKSYDNSDIILTNENGIISKHINILSYTNTETPISVVFNKNIEPSKVEWISSDPSIAEVKYVNSKTILLCSYKYGSVTFCATGKCLKSDPNFNYNNDYLETFNVDVKFGDVRNSTTSDTYKAIEWGCKNNLIKGMDNGQRFGYNQNITRLSTAIILYRYFVNYLNFTDNYASEKLDLFSDTKKYSYESDAYKAIRWCYKSKITVGYSDGTFRPDNEIKRSEFAIMLYRFVRFLNSTYNLNIDISYNYSIDFIDLYNVNVASDKFKAISWTSKHGICKGYSDGSFGVDRQAFRESAMIMIYRLDYII